MSINSKPFDGAITTFYNDHAPQKIRTAIAGGAKSAVLNPSFPYETRMKRRDYDEIMAALQIELVKMQAWASGAGKRIAIVFEGRDAAGKGGTIKRFGENLNPRGAKIIALSKPTNRERGQWYFQRYIRHMPSAGEIVFFDRSWYNRAVIEPVFGFCTEVEREHFFNQVPDFERMLLDDGVILIKIWLTVGRAEQLRRLLARESDPLKQWKLSGIDVKGVTLWAEYSAAIKMMFENTHSKDAPWNVIRADDKRRARIAAIRLVLSQLEYGGKNANVVQTPDTHICGTPALMGLEQN
ncbi:MAG: polyphosphate kinase 2 [Paracoccaceae bacterium]